MDALALKKLSKLQRNKVLLSYMFGVIGSSVFTFGVGLLILTETGSATNFGISQLIGPLVSVILMPIVGSITDKYSRKKIVIWGQLCSITAIILFAFAYQSEVFPKLIAIYLLLTVLRMSDSFLSVAFNASLVSMVNEEDLISLKSIERIIISAATIFSLFLGSALYQLLSFEHFILFELAAEVLTLIIVFTLKFKAFAKEEPAPITEEDDSSVFSMFLNGLRYIKSDPKIWFVMINGTCISFILTAFTVGIPFININYFKLNPTEYAAVQACLSIGVVFSSYLLSRRKNLPHILLMVYHGGISYFLFFYIFSALIFFNPIHIITFICLMLLTFSIGYAQAYANVPLNIWLSKTVSSNMQGRVFNTLFTLSSLLNPLGILMFSFLFDHYSGSAIYFIAGSIGLLMVILLPKLLKINLCTE